MPQPSSIIHKKASLSLTAALARQTAQSYTQMGAFEPAGLGEESLLPVVVEFNGASGGLLDSLWLEDSERLEELAPGFISGQIRSPTVRHLLENEQVSFAQSKTMYEPHLDAASAEVGLRPSAPDGAPRKIEEDGQGVLIGVVDTGFDLSHPAFWKDGQLRVESLLDQREQREYTREQLEKEWRNGKTPGCDKIGHGTHVASIAAGSPGGLHEGVAPNARLLLVKSDFLNTDNAVAWIFKKAAGRPCVINLSLGGHDGAHDGTGEDEKLHNKLVGEGKIVVVAAGNDRLKKLHFGHDFYAKERQEVKFDIYQPADKLPMIILNAWSHVNDTFQLTLVAPDGTPFSIPTVGAQGPFAWDLAQVYFCSMVDPSTGQAGKRIEIRFRKCPSASSLVGWRLDIECGDVYLGRLDCWIALYTQGLFRAHSFVEPSRTIAIPATGKSCISVGSYTSSNQWLCDEAPQKRHDNQAVLHRFSRFSAMGPTRDGRWKPEISAPGEHICSALAANSDWAQLLDRTQSGNRLISMPGTSMATPIVTGIVALMLQKNNKLHFDRVREILIQSARRDRFTADSNWSPVYGYGKIDAAKALSLV